MSTDFENGLRKTIDLSVRSREFTVDTLKSAMQYFLSGKSQRKGRVSMKKLSEHSGKLENVEIKGIEDFLSVAKKYDIDYAVKKEPESDTYHVFFQAGKMEDFRRAFQEFASRKQEELLNPRAEITRQQIKDMAKQVSHEPKKYKRGLSNVLFDGLLEDSNSHLCTFGNVMTILQNNTFSRDDLSSDCDGIRNIHYGDVLIKYGALVDFRNTVIPSIRANRDISKFSESSYLQNGDVVFADTAEDYTVGKATEIIGAENVAALSGLHTIPCRPQKKFAPMYLGYYFNSDYFKRQLYPMIQGTKVSSISKSEMVKSKIIIPNMQLQSRIASILKALDDRIDAAKLTSARIIEFRKGLLQQLFI